MKAIIQGIEYEICECCGKPKKGTGKSLGGIAIWVLKDFIRAKKRVDFTGQWRALCESCGFETIEIIRAWLVEERGTQYDLAGEAHTKVIERKSFFRRLAEKKGSPRIDYEVVLVMRKGEGEGKGEVVRGVVASPPYASTINPHGEGPGMAGNEAQRKRIEAGSAMERAAQSRLVGYGADPAQLGNMPTGELPRRLLDEMGS